MFVNPQHLDVGPKLVGILPADLVHVLPNSFAKTQFPLNVTNCQEASTYIDFRALALFVT